MVLWLLLSLLSWGVVPVQEEHSTAQTIRRFHQNYLASNRRTASITNSNVLEPIDVALLFRQLNWAGHVPCKWGTPESQENEIVKLFKGEVSWGFFPV